MSHKVHPKAYRLQKTEDWESRGFYGSKGPQFLQEDFAVREFLYRKLKDCGVDKIEIERFPGKVTLLIHTSRPAFIIGRGGKGIETLKQQLTNKILRKYTQPGEFKIEIREIRDPWTRATLAAQWIAFSLERRVPFRRTLKQALEKIVAHKEIKGARVEVAGRLDGNTIARTQWLKAGQLPRQTIRAEIDYGTAQAFCTYGVVGVKVWIYKGEKF